MPTSPISSNFSICPVTGYLEPRNGEGILPKHKTAFLKHYRKSCDKTAAITVLGFRYTDLEWHFANDKQFAQDFRETQLAMKHELESITFEQASKPSGHNSRQVWLATFFPEEYGKKAGGSKLTEPKSRLDGLLDDLEG